MAQISGITAASIVIPKNLLDKKKSEEEVKAVADYYDHIVKSVGQRRRSNPFLDRDELKRAADNLETPREELDLSSKEQTPSKENLSQDSGYQSVTGYRRSSFTDHYDSAPIFRSPIRQPVQDVKTNVAQSIGNNSIDNQNKLTDLSGNNQTRRGSDFGQQTKNTRSSPRRDSGIGVQLGNFANSSRTSQPSTSQITSGRKASATPRGRRSVSRSKSPSKRGISISRKETAVAPAITDNWNSSSKARKTSPSPMRKEIAKAKSPSPTPSRRPKLKEIMTQTSGYLESFEMFSYSRTSTPGSDRTRQDELMARAEVKVRSAVDWLMDLAMFAVACWLYLFQNELLAIPVLLIMVYRQLKEEIRKRIPAWLIRRLQKKKTDK